MRYLFLYMLFNVLLFMAISDGLNKSLAHRCSIGLVPSQYCQK